MSDPGPIAAGSHTFEPELNQPAPRPVRLRTPAKFRWACYLFFPHAWAGVVILYFALRSTFLTIGVLVADDTVSAAITDMQTGKRKGGTFFRITYEFTVDDRTYQSKVDVDSSFYDRTQVGGTIPVRLWRAFPDASHWPVAQGHPHWRNLAGIWFATLFWNAIVFIFVGAYSGWKFGVHSDLVARGSKAVGHVVSVSAVPRGKGIAKKYHRVVCEFRTRDGREKPPCSMEYDRAEAAQFKPGELVTILYWKDLPETNVVYRLANYEAYVPEEHPADDRDRSR